MSTATVERPQALEALDLANEIRNRQAERRRELRVLTPRNAALLAASWLEEPDEIVARMRLGYLLASIPRFGRIRANKVTTAIGLTTGALNRRIGPTEFKSGSRCDVQPLAGRQRQAVADELRKAAERAKA